MREVGQRLQQSREVANMWIDKLGAQPQGKIGNLVNEILRSLSFDLSLKAADLNVDDIEEMPAVAGMLKDLALTTMRLEKAANLNVEREKEIRQQALEEAADAIGEEAKAQGMDEEQAEFWRKRVLGVR
jgi:ribosomal protein S13